MFHPMLARWLAVSLALLALTVSAQTRPLEYRSALEGYQPYSENKMVPWKEANDTVGKVGGWRAYAKEAAEGRGQQEQQGHTGHAGHSAPAASAPKPAASQAKP